MVAVVATAATAAAMRESERDESLLLFWDQLMLKAAGQEQEQTCVNKSKQIKLILN